MQLRSFLAHMVSIAHLAFVTFILTRATPTAAQLLPNVHSMPHAVVMNRGSRPKKSTELARALCEEEAWSQCGLVL